MKLNITVAGKPLALNVIDGENAVTTFKELREAIAEFGNLDPANMKIIHRGKTLTGNDDLLLEDYKFQENDKLIVMGKPMEARKGDPGFALLNKYEKDHLLSLQKQYEEMTKDLTDLQKNHLDKDKSREMVKRMDKRLKTFAEMSLRHLEALDGLSINREDTPEDQATRNREKRKSLVKGIQQLLNLSDKNVRQLEEYSKKLEGEIVE